MAFYAAALAPALALEALVNRVRDGRAGERLSPARHGLVAYLAATAVAAALALTTPWGRDLQVVYYALSWFQPLVFGALALAFGAVAWLERRGVDRRRAWLAGALGLAASAAVFGLAGSGTLAQGVEFLVRSDPVAATLLESRSLVELGAGYAVRWLTLVGVALPALWAAAAILAIRRGRLDPLLAAALAVGLLAGLMTVLQMRFGPHAAVAAGLLAAWLVGQLRRALPAGAAVAVMAALLAWGVRPATLPDSAVHPYLLGGFDALVWLRHAPPPTSHYHQPWRRPEYGVAAEWVWGHWITQIGRKPNIANPLGQTARNREGVAEIARLFLAESEAEADSIIARLGIRYLLLSSIPVTVSELAVQAGRDPSRYVLRGPDGADTFLQPFYDTFHSRLYLGGGAGVGPTEPVSGVRLVFESRVRIDFQGRPMPAVRIFEVVPGATLHGRCASDVVEAWAALEDADLVYAVRGAPGPDGEFALAMPYASERTRAAIPARITVRCGEHEVVVDVAEQDVLAGRRVEVRPRP